MAFAAVRLKGDMQDADAEQAHVSIRQHTSACFSIRQQGVTQDADAVQPYPADVLKLRKADAVQQMQVLQQHATAGAERSDSGSKRNTFEAHEQDAICNRCNSTLQHARTSEACTLRIGNVSRYSVYLLYWYNSTNTGFVYWEMREEDLRGAISPHSIRMLTYADAC
jgi:hypothetical protein